MRTLFLWTAFLGASLLEPDSGLQQTNLKGLWSRYTSTTIEDPVRFYYFHDDGKIGLYRYGKIGLNNTNSFDFQVQGGKLQLLFRKTGQKAQTDYRIERAQGKDWLILKSDPKENIETRYFRVSSENQLLEEPMFLQDSVAHWGRMWTHQEKFATGGIGFRIYQLREPNHKGKGIGWHHQGDYDDWSTEQLDYQLVNNKIEFFFKLRKERASTPFVLENASAKRRLLLQEDPRNFWHQSTLLDGGRSF